MLAIKVLRERKAMSQNELADKIGVDRTSVTKWESGSAVPSATKLPKIAEVLCCSIDDLFQPISGGEYANGSK